MIGTTGRRRASIVFPDPGEPTRRLLCRYSLQAKRAYNKPNNWGSDSLATILDKYYGPAGLTIQS